MLDCIDWRCRHWHEVVDSSESWSSHEQRQLSPNLTTIRSSKQIAANRVLTFGYIADCSREFRFHVTPEVVFSELQLASKSARFVLIEGVPRGLVTLLRKRRRCCLPTRQHEHYKRSYEEREKKRRSGVSDPLQENVGIRLMPMARRHLQIRNK